MGRFYQEFIQCELPTHTKKRRPNNRHVESFLTDVRNQLVTTKKPVCVFCKFQLEKLKNEFGDRLEYKYDAANKWWVCKLKKEGK